MASPIDGMDADELAEWIECLEDVSLRHGPRQAAQLLATLHEQARRLGVTAAHALNDGQFQKYSVAAGEYIRDDFFGKSPELRALVEDLSDEQLERLNRGGHDPCKVYAAYRAAVEHTGAPTVVLAKTIKGYGLGEAGEGRNITHKQKELNEDDMLSFRSRFDVPLDDEEVADAPFFRPDDDSPELTYVRDRRALLGGPLPARAADGGKLDIPPLERFASTNVVKAAIAAMMTMIRHSSAVGMSTSARPCRYWISTDQGNRQRWMQRNRH